MGEKKTTHSPRPLEVEIDFELPLGYKDEGGTLHKKGVMRLATAADEILPMRDPRVQQNPEYLSVIVLSRVVTELGSIAVINTGVIERLYRKDYDYLIGLYERFNENGYDVVKVKCSCGKENLVEIPKPGE